MPKHFNIFYRAALGLILIVGLGAGSVIPVAHAEAPFGQSYITPSTTAALDATIASNFVQQPAPAPEIVVDGLTATQRAAKIDAFFTDRNVPMAGLGKTFVDDADKYNVDWRLVAAIAYNESTAGAHECRGKDGQKTYNAFGYGSCKITFDSYNDAIDTVTRDVAGLIPATASQYAGKTVEEKIEAYNPKEYNPNYQHLVAYVMNKITTTDADASTQIAMK